MSKLGRVESQIVDDHLEVSVKVLKNPYVYIPLIVTMIVWFYGLSFLVEKVLLSYRTLIEMGIAGMLFFWLIVGGVIFSTLYWIFLGKEKIVVTHDFIQTEKAIHLYKRRRAYSLNQVSDIRVDNEMYKVKRNGVWKDENRVVVKFNTPNKEVTFGRGLTPDESEFILLQLSTSEFFEEHQFQVVSKI